MSRMEKARENLTKDLYLAAKANGKSDNVIMKQYFGAIWGDVLSDMKTEWGIPSGRPNMQQDTKEPTLQETLEQAATEALIKAADKINKDMLDELINGSPDSAFAGREPIGIFQAEAINQAVKVDIEKPEGVSLAMTQHMKEVFDDFETYEQEAELAGVDLASNIILPPDFGKMNSPVARHAEVFSAFDLADEFYNLQEENVGIDIEANRLLSTMQENTERMDKIRVALEAITVTI